MPSVYLHLQNGQVLKGHSFGAAVDAVGELVFQTSVVGYQETFTDPAYHGQIVVQTFPLLGNYGAISADDLSACHPAGVVCREVCAVPSNFRCEETLPAWMEKQGMAGISGIDTRALTAILREQGSMNALITASAVLSEEQKELLANYRVQDAVAAVTTKEAYEKPAVGDAHWKAAVLDLGLRRDLADLLAASGAALEVLPAAASIDEILAAGPDLLVLSGGPGDPSDNAAVVANVKALLGKLPVLGVGLGCQVLALALGAECEKMHHGHRGGSQPVKDAVSGRTLITGQNHGYAVKADTLPESAEVRFVSANDGSCEGFVLPELRAMGLQFDLTASLAAEFCTMLGGN